MKNLLFGITAVIGLTGLLVRPECIPAQRMVAQAVSTPSSASSAPSNPAVPAAPAVPLVPAAPKPVTGDLVIDFMGDIRGYVEPCG